MREGGQDRRPGEKERRRRRGEKARRRRGIAAGERNEGKAQSSLMMVVLYLLVV